MVLKNVIFITLLLYSINLFAQVDEITVRQISPDGGFCFKAISTIKQDLSGYMWFGTEQGLIRYDSRNADWFVFEPDDSLGLPDNTIHSIAIDNNNVVWIATGKGLCFFDREIQKFRKVPIAYENGIHIESEIVNIAVDGNNNLWLSNENYFGIFNRETYRFNRINSDNPIHISVLYVDYLKRIWFGDERGDIYKVTPDRKYYRKVVEGSGTPSSSIFIGPDEILVGYDAKGVKRYNYQGELTKYFRLDNLGNNIENINIRSLLKDTYGRLWIAAYEGLFLYQDQNIYRFNSDNRNNNYTGIPHNSIHELFEDNQGGIWIGTWAGGVAYIHHSDNKFQNYHYSQLPYSLTNNVVSSFSQIEKGNILVATEGGGLNVLNTNNKKFTSLSFSGNINANHIKTVKVDRFGGVWIGTFVNGLWYRAPKSQSFTQITGGAEDGNHISQNRIYAMCEIDSGMLIGTYGGGLNFYNFKTKDISFFNTPESENNVMNGRMIRSIFSDSNNNIWVGANSGLYKANLNMKKLVKYFSPTNEGVLLSENTVYFITELSDNLIWFGLRGRGIITLDLETEQFTHIDADGLLRGKDVYGIIEDDENKVWITSNNGLLLYNPHNNVIRHFISKDGIQGDIFNPQAIFKDDEGYLYFGGTTGFTRLNPSNIQLNTRMPKILINKIVINNRDARYPIKQLDSNYKTIQLEPFETTIRIEFTSDSYLLPEKNLFKYRLVNYYDEWIDAGNDGSLLFVNLPNDEFILEIKASNNDGVWNEIPVRLPIYIGKYWYETNLAFIIYSLLIIGVTGLVFRFLMERSRLKKEVLVEKINHQHEEQLSDMKLKFFTNISHEFRTPLTLIIGPLRKLMDAKNLTSEQKQVMEVANRNSGRLLQLVNQILDLRKADNYQNKLIISKFNIVKFIEEIHLHFIEQAKINKIHFDFISSQPEIFIEADKQKIDKIIFNLLSNAFKNTPVNGKILVSVMDHKDHEQVDFPNQLSFGSLNDDDHVNISILDSGYGIVSEDLIKVFNRFEQGNSQKSFQSSKEMGTGIGLSLCKNYTLLHNGVIKAQTLSGKGAKFTITLPKKQHALKILQEDFELTKDIQFKKSTLKNVKVKDEKQKESQILIVEDNNDLLEYIGGILKHSYKVKYAHNGKEGLVILNTSQIDLVVSDVMMPEIDGFEMCRIIKYQLETSHIPVILLTALSSSNNKVMGLDKGADAYLTKPFDEKVLLSQVSNLILQRNRLRQNFKNIFLSDKTFDAGNLDNYFLNKLNKIIEARYTDEKFSVEELSSEIGFSRSQLHRKLVTLTNRSTSEYIRLFRIKKAAELLHTHQYNIDEVAFKVGFNSSSYFSKCFKIVYKISPKEFS